MVVSLAKLKQHDTAGVTLTMKNMFGITPRLDVWGKPGDEDFDRGRGPSTIRDATWTSSFQD